MIASAMLPGGNADGRLFASREGSAASRAH
jgi:hypothetical protein